MKLEQNIRFQLIPNTVGVTKPNFRIEYYNPDSKKLEEIATAEVKKDRKNYNLTTVKFKLQEKWFCISFHSCSGFR